MGCQEVGSDGLDQILTGVYLFSPFRVLLARNLLNLGCGFFAYSSKLPAYSGAFLLTVENFSFFTYNWSFSAYILSFSTYSWSFLLTVG